MIPSDSDSPGLLAPDLRARLQQADRDGFVPWSDAEFGAWAIRLFRLQFHSNPAYGAWCRSLGVVPEGVADWREIPAVPTEAFKALDLSLIPDRERTACFLSSGTTGQARSRHHHCPASLALYEASAAPWFRAHLVDGFPVEAPPRFLNLVPSSSAAPQSSLAHMVEHVALRFGDGNPVQAGRVGSDGGWEVDVDAAVGALRAAEARRDPLLVTGTAFGFVHLLDAMEARGERVRLPAGSRVMETGGYKGRSRVMPKEALHAAIRGVLGVCDAAVVTEYGMGELGSQAYDRIARSDAAVPSPRRLRFPPWCRARVVSPESGAEVPAGAEGVVRVLDLANVWSVAAVQTADRARGGADGLELLGRVAASEPRGCSLMAT